MCTFTRRDLLRGGLALGATVTLPNTRLWARSALEEIRLGFVSCGGRGGELMKNFDQIDGTRIVGLCDPDQNRLGAARSRYPK
jgi:hypothetical protein